MYCRTTFPVGLDRRVEMEGSGPCLASKAGYFDGAKRPVDNSDKLRLTGTNSVSRDGLMNVHQANPVLRYIRLVVLWLADGVNFFSRERLDSRRYN